MTKQILSLAFAVVLTLLGTTAAMAQSGPQATGVDIVEGQKTVVVQPGTVAHVDLWDGTQVHQTMMAVPGTYAFKSNIPVKGGKVWNYATTDSQFVLEQIGIHIHKLRASGTNTDITDWSNIFTQSQTVSAQQTSTANPSVPTIPEASALGPWIVNGQNVPEVVIDGTRGIAHISIWYPGQGSPDTEYSVVVSGVKVRMRAGGTGWQWNGFFDRQVVLADIVRHADARASAGKITAILPLEKVNAVLPGVNVQIIP
jgi:hypothetical protein